MEGTFEDGAPSFTQVCETDPEFYVPLYTAPPQRQQRTYTLRKWVGLTDDEIIDAANMAPFETMVSAEDYIYIIARAIEEASRRKNG